MQKILILTIFLLSVSCVADRGSKQKELSDSKPNGKELFMKSCASCHATDMKMEMTAPPLGNVINKRGKEWVYNYTKNADLMLRQGDSIALQFRKEGWSLMPSYSSLSEQELDSIFAFVQREFEKKE